MDLRSKLEENITGVLPHLSGHEVEKTVDHLLAQGVKKERDLRHMTIPILKEILDTVDSSDLYVDWQNKYAGQEQPSSSRDPLSTINSNANSSRSSARGASSLQTAARQSISRLPVFDAESPYFPAGVKTAIQQKKRPLASEREKMVERIVDHCREVVPNLSRLDLDNVARDLVVKFPATFKDSCPISDHGSDGLARQMKSKFDNDKRPKGSMTPVEKAAPNIPQAFGCKTWNPPCPENHTELSQEKIMQDLQKAYKLSRRDRDWKTIMKNMEESFYLQRRHINKDMTEQRRKRRRDGEEIAVDPANKLSIMDLRANWPFLFLSKGLNLHYKLLTGIDFKEKLHQYVNENANIVIEYLSTKNESLRKIVRMMNRADKAGYTSTTFPTFLKMIIVNFSEDPKELLRFVERTTSTLEEMQNMDIEFPESKTPFLAIAGSTIYDYESVFISIDNNFVAKVDSIQEAFAYVFSSYFVFNIEFPTTLATLFNFSLRMIAGEHQYKGTKCATAAIQRRVNDRLLTFCNKLEAYRQTVDSEEQENL